MGNVCTHCQFDFDKARQEAPETAFTMYCVEGVTVCKPCLWKHHRGAWLRFKWGALRSWFRDHFSAVAHFFSGLRFAFKPTFYVVATPQQALDLVAARGGTVMFCAGEFVVPKEGLQVPPKDVRIIGANLKIPEGGVGINVPSDKKARVHIIGCSFMGLGAGAESAVRFNMKDPQ